MELSQRGSVRARKQGPKSALALLRVGMTPMYGGRLQLHSPGPTCMPWSPGAAPDPGPTRTPPGPRCLLTQPHACPWSPGAAPTPAPTRMPWAWGAALTPGPTRTPLEPHRPALLAVLKYPWWVMSPLGLGSHL